MPVENRDEVKRTNEIKMAIPLLDALEIKGKEVSADALLTQRRLAIGAIKSRGARSVAQKMRQLTRHVRLVFDYLRMSGNSCARRAGA